MNRATCVLSGFALACISFMAGCTGGTTNPPPSSNPVPAITAATPGSAIAGSTDTSVTITGSGFIPSSTAQWNGAPIVTTYNSTTSVSVTLAASRLANGTIAKLTVVNPSPGGGTSAAIDFSVNNPAPTITSVSPANVTAGATATTLDVKGNNFLAASVAIWNSAPLVTTLVSSTEVTATLPAADLTGSSASLIVVQNPAPGGGTSAPAIFDVNSPVAVITAISPRFVPPGSAATILITGTGFESNSVVLWNGSARPTTVVSTSVLQVALTATDLQNQGTGLLTVSNPGPAASTSPAAQLAITAQPIPMIQSVSIANGPPIFGGCPQLQVTVTGQNFAYDSTIQANGVSLQNIYGGNYGGSPTTLVNYLPAGFVSQPGALSFTVTNPSQGMISAAFPYPATNAATMVLCATPSPTTVYAGSSFSFTVQPTEVNISGNGTLTLGSLPAGITSQNVSVALPPSGATLHLQASNSTAAGTYDLILNGTVGTSTAAGDFNFTVNTGTPPIFYFTTPLSKEVGVPIGGSGSIQYGTLINSSGSVDFDVTPSVSGLPPGTTATFSPSVFSAGQSVTVTLHAASNAPVTQNASVTLIGTPSAQVSNATANFLADVTQPPGSLPGNRTDFVPTAGTPFAAAYDATHDLIFASNPDWNRVDVISNATHKIVKSIPIRSPRGLDITQDNSHVWVQTSSPNIYAVDTTSLHAKHYSLPSRTLGNGGGLLMFANDRLLALSDGTIFLYFNDATGNGGGSQAGVWNPQTNRLTILASGFTSAFGLPSRSGDGTHVYASNISFDTGMEVYNANSQTLTKIGSGTSFSFVVAVNGDGTRLVLGDTNRPLNLYDNNLTMLGVVPGSLTGLGFYFPGSGGYVFSRDSKTLYGIGLYNGMTDVLTIDTSSLHVSGVAPASPVEPVATSGGIGTSTPFAVDPTGMVLGLQTYGIAFDDSTFYQTYATNQPGFNQTNEYIATFAGPLAGGTISSLFSSSSFLTPDVWFGQTRGSASSTSGELTFTSPPGTTPGPANVKFIYPDGEQAFYPQLFSYSTFPEYSLLSGSSPDGGAPARILGYGLPQDPSEGTLSVGTHTATITTVKGQYPPLGGEPYPSTILDYNFPPSAPGWSDIAVSTPIGSGKLPKSVFYATSVIDYSSPDSFTAVLVDEKRKQVYLSAGDHIDVFSTASNKFITPLQPAAQGSLKQFTGLALTPDGGSLLAADLPDGSLAVINPDAPASTYAIAITTQHIGDNNCPDGPLYVAATSANQAFVQTGSLPAPSCPQNGNVYIANLMTHTSVPSPQCGSGLSVDATADGNFVAIGLTPCIYSVQSGSYTTGLYAGGGVGHAVAMSGDGNVLGFDQVMTDLSLTLLGDVAQPIALYASLSGIGPPNVLLRPRLNTTGSLYYFAYPNYLEIVDVAHALLRMRFSLTQTIQDTASPLAIDSGGQHVYLLTDKGLTVIDLGFAPLSIGHMSQSNAAPGSQIVVRGSGFDSGTTATVGGVPASVSISDENTLTLTVPAASPGPEDIVLTRSDGETYTLENGVVLP